MTDFRTVMERHGFGQLKAVAPIKPAPILPVTQDTVTTHTKGGPLEHDERTLSRVWVIRTWT